MEINFTESEAETLEFYLEKALVDAKGMYAIGSGSKKAVLDLISITQKIRSGNVIE